MNNIECINFKVKKIDSHIFNKIQSKNNIKVHSIFTRTFNVIIDKTLVTIGYNIPMSKHRIIIDKVNFKEYTITTSSILKPHKRGFSIDKLFFEVSKESLNCYKPYTIRKIIKEEHMIRVKKLLEWLIQHPKANILNVNNYNYIIKYQLKRINEFFEQESLDTALSIIGMGVGLTPFGDDVLLGYIFAKMVIDNRSNWIYKILPIVKKQSNIISYQNLKDILDGYYTEHLIQMVDEFFDKNTFEKVNLVLNYGATSGVGIVLGFIFGLLPQGDVRNECLESIKKYLL